MNLHLISVVTMPAHSRSKKSGGEVDVATHITEDSTVIVSEEKISKVDLLTDVVSVVRNENWVLSVLNGSARKNIIHTFIFTFYNP